MNHSASGHPGRRPSAGLTLFEQNRSECGLRTDHRVETAWYRNRATVAGRMELTRVERQRIGTIAGEIPVEDEQNIHASEAD